MRIYPQLTSSLNGIFWLKILWPRGSRAHTSSPPSHLIITTYSVTTISSFFRSTSHYFRHRFFLPIPFIVFYTVPAAAEEAIPAVLELWLAAFWLIKHTPKIIS